MNCKHCGIKLLVKRTQRNPAQLTKQYYYIAYYFCPNCHRTYHDDIFKVMNENQSLFTNQDSMSDSPVDVEIWTDGACTNNGNPQAKAAWAFISGTYEKAGLVQGKQTNNVAEALAIYHALVWAAERGYRHIRIHSDSQITLYNLRKKWQQIKANQEIFQQIFAAIAEKGLQVQYVKVAGHSGDENNERVDKLANGLVAS